MLNEPWFDEPYDLAGFLLRVYRPPLHDQFEWTFPVELQALRVHAAAAGGAAVMEVVGRRPLDFYMPLHNSDFSGAYFYLSAEDEALQDELAAVMAAAGLPPHCGEPEVPYLRTLAPTASSAPSRLADDYDFYEAYGADPAVVAHQRHVERRLRRERVGLLHAGRRGAVLHQRAGSPTRARRGSRAARPSCAASRSQQQLAGWLHERYVEAASAAHRARRPGSVPCTRYLAEVKDDLRAERAQAETEPGVRRRGHRRAALRSASTCASSTRCSRIGQFASMVAAEPEQDDVLRDLHDEAVAEVRTRAERLAARRRHRGAADPGARAVPARGAALRAWWRRATATARRIRVRRRRGRRR